MKLFISIAIIILGGCGVDVFETNLNPAQLEVQALVLSRLQTVELWHPTLPEIPVQVAPIDEVELNCMGNKYGCSYVQSGILLRNFDDKHLFCIVLAHEYTHFMFYYKDGNPDPTHRKLDQFFEIGNIACDGVAKQW